MRGKKSDVEFVSNFITECASKNLCAPELIVAEAQKSIKEIDQEIKEVENKKIIRSKLLDVINTFDNKKTKVEDVKILQLFEIKNHYICKPICQIIKEKPVKINDITEAVKHNMQDVLFCIKQLMEYKVISKTGDYFLRGIKFEEYTTIVLKEK